jgi:hypothetical protein
MVRRLAIATLAVSSRQAISLARPEMGDLPDQANASPVFDTQHAHDHQETSARPDGRRRPPALPVLVASGELLMIQIVAAVLLALHGVIHLIGFVTPWRIATLQGFTYRTTALNGTLEIGDGGARLVGLLWLALAVGFVVAGYGVWRGKPWAPALTGVLAAASLVICVLGLPEAFAGITINLVILGAVGYVAFFRPT